MRCIETLLLVIQFLQRLLDKLQHEMYWNNGVDGFNSSVQDDKLQHEMYWNVRITRTTKVTGKINYNMRCIETILPHSFYFPNHDKLQHEMYWNSLDEAEVQVIAPDKLQHEMYWNKVRAVRL